MGGREMGPGRMPGPISVSLDVYGLVIALTSPPIDSIAS